MKIMKLFGMGIVSLMLCAGFVSCGDDEPKGGNNDSGTEVPALEKHLVKYKEHGEGMRSYSVTDYLYDDKDNLDKWKKYDTDKQDVISGNIDEYSVYWTGNTCYLEDNGVKYQEFVYDASGKAVSMTNKTSVKSASEKYEYDDQGRLLRESYAGSYSSGDTFSTVSTYTWKGNQLVSVIHKSETMGKFEETITNTLEFSYTGRKVKGALIPVKKHLHLFVSSELVNIHPERFGALTDELPSKVTITEISTKSLTYKVDNKITSMNSKSNGIFLLEDVKVDQDGYLVGVNTKWTTDTYFTNYNYDTNGDGKISKDEEVVKKELLDRKISWEEEYVWANK